MVTEPCSCGFGFPLAHGIALQFDAIGVVEEAIENRVSHRGIIDELMPGIQGVLTGEEGRPGALSVIKDFEEEPVLIGLEGRQAPVVDEEQVDFG